MTIVMDWMPEMAVPEVIITDPGSGFASEVMACVYKILGVKERQVKERGAKGPVSVVEAKHRILNIVLSDGFASGSIKDARSFRVFTKFAQIRETQTARAGHVSQYELWCGQAPNTAESLIIASAEGVEMPTTISSKDQEAVQMIAQQCGRLVQYELELRDEKARANNMRRDIAEGVHGTTGDEV